VLEISEKAEFSTNREPVPPDHTHTQTHRYAHTPNQAGLEPIPYKAV